MVRSTEISYGLTPTRISHSNIQKTGQVFKIQYTSPSPRISETPPSSVWQEQGQNVGVDVAAQARWPQDAFQGLISSVSNDTGLPRDSRYLLLASSGHSSLIP